MVPIRFGLTPLLPAMKRRGARLWISSKSEALISYEEMAYPQEIEPDALPSRFHPIHCFHSRPMEDAVSSVKLLLVVEDQPDDILLAAQTAKSIGIPQVEARTSIQAARNYLEGGLTGQNPLPDGIVLDLDLGYDSGYELLRYWHSTPALSGIPVIVWSILGDNQREMCRLFKVSRFIAKWEGTEAFREALASLSKSTT